MKAIRNLVAIALVLSIPSIYAEKKKNGPIPRKPPSHEDIAKRQQEHSSRKPTIVPSKQKARVTIKKRSLIANSTLLANRGHWTLVPKGAVIHIPAHLKSKVVTKPKGTLLNWGQFLRKNYGWLHEHSVRMEQAQGKKPIAPDVIKAYKSMSKIVVATCAGNPISVAPKSLILKKEK